MRFCVSATEAVWQGLPPLELSLDVTGFDAVRFPERGTIVALEAPGGLPCVDARWTQETIRDAGALGAFLERDAGRDLAAFELGEAGDLALAGETRAARLFYARTRAGEPVAGCAVAVPFWSPVAPPFSTLVLLLAIPGTRVSAPSVGAVAGQPALSNVLASFRLRLPGEKAPVAADDPSRRTIRIATPLERASAEIEALRATIGGAAPLPALDDGRRELLARLDEALAHARPLIESGFFQPPEDAAFSIAWAGLDEGDPLANEVEDALARIVGLLVND
jgi:hypothetical protein